MTKQEALRIKEENIGKLRKIKNVLGIAIRKNKKGYYLDILLETFPDDKCYNKILKLLKNVPIKLTIIGKPIILKRQIPIIKPAGF